MSMVRTHCVTAVVSLLAFPAWAANGSSGAGALALATLVSDHSPAISHFDKRTLTKLFTGHTNVSYPAGHTITVKADKITCKTSDVDITLHSCDLVFGPRTFTITARAAHELYTTLAENGVPGGAAAGTQYEALTQLSCTIDPNVIVQRAGGGATCTYTPAP
jgi:hypothetical protein